ncbi:BolA family protein [Halioxenophilus sp. WMMB6]|uniref:BolA family protein n=1 Tax=Halioxenophilus sp. WMMB6 TaxID=3073815 RepID=UPI00295E40FF|nr:BolA/IbaG family iron-sulfur metabolism protein [Halioxenophilus sp. WMMB6]
MESQFVEQKVAELVPEAEIEVEGADCDFSVTVISEHFQGMTKVKRQQLVLSGFSDYLATGELHALTVKAFTMDEWNNKTNGLVQLSL